MRKTMKHRMISLMLTVAMLISMVPSNIFSIFAVGSDEETPAISESEMENNVGKQALFNISAFINFPVDDDPATFNDDPYTGEWEDSPNYLYYYDGGADPTQAQYDFDAYFTMEIIDYYYNPTTYALWYKVKAADGYTLPALMNENPWVFFNWTDVYEDPELAAIYLDSLIIMDGTNKVYDSNGNLTAAITMPQYQKPEFTAASSFSALTADVSYRWQIEYEAGQWVDIYGEDSATINVSYGIVAQLLNENGFVYIRCESKAGTRVAYSPAIPVTVEWYDSSQETASEPEENTAQAQATTYSARSLARSAVMPLADETTGGTTVSDPVTVTIKFVYGSDPTKLVAETITSTIQKGTAYELLDYTLPVMEGYSAYYEDDTNTIHTEVDIQLETVNEDVTITFKYWPAKVNYTVIYYWQNADNDDYTEHERVVLTDFTGNMTTVEDKEYDGFYQLLYETVPIASDGSTVIEVYYDRYYYLMLFNLDGGYGVQPVYARHGATLPDLTPSKAGCDFVGWDSDADSDDLSDSNFPTTMPIGDTSYTAIWQYSSDKVDVHIVVWGENPNDEEYSYWKSETIQVAPGTEINYKDSILICEVEEHTHSDACGYDCGKEEHSHDSCMSVCGEEGHTHNTGCYADVGEATTHINAPSNPQNGQIYYWNIIITNGKSIYINGTWYEYNGSLNGGDIASTTCGKNESTHTHSDACYSCGKETHSHESCNLACGKNAHTHSDSCYTSDDLMTSTLWTLVKSDTVTVAPDGSTILNVYYDRTEFTLTFKYNYSGGTPQTTQAITDKWGANISKEYQAIVDDADTTFWTLNSRGNEGPYTNYFGVMPQASATYYNNDVNGDSGSMQYWGQDLEGDYTINLFTAPNVGGFTVTDEDRYEFEGYTYSHGSGNGTDCEDAVFYYKRNTYILQFHDNGETGVLETETVYYEAPLSTYGNYKLTADDAPSKYEPGSVEFAGWYTNPEGEGEPFDFANSTMPASNIILYAKWTPVTHTVRFYTDKQYVGTDTIYTNSNGDQYIYEVPHGSKLQDPLTPPADPTKGQYEFNGWYYIDATGNEQRWDFENTTVTRDVDVYAKWSSNKLMPYTIKYVYKDTNGNEIEIADPTTGSALGGNSKTFEAKGNEQLYKDYQEGYFPTTQSHTITIDLENTANNEFTFYYVKVDAVPYSVYYVTESQNESGTLNPIELNGKTYYIVADTEVVSDNKKAIVTETYKPVAGYLPDNYQETLVINPNATEDNPNQIIFIYTKDEENSMYVVHYYFEKVTGGTYTEDLAYLFQSKAQIGSTVNAAIPTVDNFTHNPNATGTVLSGTVEEGKVLELYVYYERNEYPYKVQYLEAGTLKVLSPEKIVTGNLWESSVTEEYIDIDNYTLSSDAEVTIQIRKDTDDPTVNIITFFYTEDKATITYVPVGNGSVDPESETVKASTGTANGSTPAADANNRFVGWFEDAACTDPVDAEDGTFDVGTGKFTPAKPGDLWVDITYYAKFEQLGSLTISKVVANIGTTAITNDQTFTFIVTLPAGYDYDDYAPAGTTKISDSQFSVTITVTEDVGEGTKDNPTSSAPVSVKIEGLPCGTYAILESPIDGFAPNFANGQTSAEVNADGVTVGYTNTYPVYAGDLTVEKIVDKAYEKDTLPGDYFELAITLTPVAGALKTTNTYVYDYTIYHTVGQPTTVEDNSVTFALDESGNVIPARITIRLKAGEYVTFMGFPVGAYAVEEIGVYDSFEGGNSRTLAETGYSAAPTYEHSYEDHKIYSELLEGNKAPKVTVTNTYERTKSNLTINKTVNNNSKEALAGGTFTFEITLPTDGNFEGNTYKCGEHTHTVVNGKITVTLTISGDVPAESSASASITVEGLPAGDYVIKEINIPAGYGSIQPNDTIYTTLKDGAEGEISFTNNYPVYDIHYIPVGEGSVTTSVEYVINTAEKGVGSTATPKPGYRFIGWFTDATCEGEPISTELTYVPTKPTDGWPEAGLTFYAKFAPMASLTIEKEVKNADKVALENNVFTFEITLPDGMDIGTYSAGLTWTSGANVSIENGKIVVTFTMNVAANGSNSASVTISGLPEGEYTVEETKIQTGFKSNWTDNTTTVEVAYDSTTVAKASCTNEYPVYTYNYVVQNGVGGTVGLGNAAGSGTSVSESFNYVTGTVQGATAAAGKGYSFVGWYSDEGCTQLVSSELEFVPEKKEENQTFYAKFKEIVVYYEADNGGSVSIEMESAAGKGEFSGSTATANAGYVFDGWYYNGKKLENASVTLIPSVSEDGGKTFVAKFVEQTIRIEYVVVGPDGCGTVNLSGSVSSTGVSEIIGKATGTAVGAVANANTPTFKFVGWYSDKECTKLVSTELHYTPEKVNGLNVAATYYAKFEYNLTSLTIEKKTVDEDGNEVDYSSIDPNQTFIFELVMVKDADGNDVPNGQVLTVTVHRDENGNWSTTIECLTVGATYTITEKTDWSWRYNCIGWEHTNGGSGTTNTATITLGVNGTITFTNEREEEKWLDGDSWFDNLFNGN